MEQKIQKKKKGFKFDILLEKNAKDSNNKGTNLAFLLCHD